MCALNRGKNGTYETLNKKRIMCSTFRTLGNIGEGVKGGKRSEERDKVSCVEETWQPMYLKIRAIEEAHKMC